MLRLSRPSPALVISLIALFVALGGTGYAAIKIGSKQIKNNSVSSKDLKNNSATGKDVKSDSLKGGDIDEGSLAKVPSAAQADDAASVGGLAPAALAKAPLWANVAKSGAILAQSGGIDVTFNEATDLYFINFGQDVRGRSLTMTRLITADDANAAGSWAIGVCGGGADIDCTAVSPSVPNDGKWAVAGLTNAANNVNQAHAFSVLVF